MCNVKSYKNDTESKLRSFQPLNPHECVESRGDKPCYENKNHLLLYIL